MDIEEARRAPDAQQRCSEPPLGAPCKKACHAGLPVWKKVDQLAGHGDGDGRCTLGQGLHRVERFLKPIKALPERARDWTGSRHPPARVQPGSLQVSAADIEAGPVRIPSSRAGPEIATRWAGVFRGSHGRFRDHPRHRPHGWRGLVHAKAGERDHYRPLVSRLALSSEPLDVVRGLLELHPFRSLYIADLDAIRKQGAHVATVRQVRDEVPNLSCGSTPVSPPTAPAGSS